MQMGENIRAVTERIIRDFGPKRLILFSVKRNLSGDEQGFKLCVVLPVQDKAETEKRIYLDIESEIPFDVLVYTPEEWEQLQGDAGSFARRIEEEGTCIYDSGETKRRRQ